VNASEWVTFRIVPHGHYLLIKSFEVIIHQVERAQIGWWDPSIGCSIDGINGVGEMERTVALDCCRSVMLVSGAVMPIDGTCKDGSTIRCEERGKRWYIDGRLVASADQSDGVVVLLDEDVTDWAAVPALSTKGSFTVSDVEYYLH
jgi:hypothetical protein